MNDRIDRRAFDLIVRYETGGRDYYENVYRSGPCWPGGSSGVTIGCGYDLGYEQHFAADWQGRLSPSEFDRLNRCVGKRGQRAKQALSGVRGIEISWEMASEVFNDISLPQEIRLTLKTFPESADKLAPVAFGALVSVVFNRGSDLEGPRRVEMATIRRLIVNERESSSARPGEPLHRHIAGQIRAMKRLWRDDRDSDQDLVDRREEEAKLVEAALA